MIITSLNATVEAKEQKSVDFTPLPKGKYTVSIKDIGDWESYPPKNIKVKETGETLSNFVVYYTDVQLEVIEPAEFAGRTIRDRISTHPNMPWQIEGFLHANNVPSLALTQIKSLVGNQVEAYVGIEEVKKVIKVTDQNTGIEEEHEDVKVYNRISRYMKPEAKDLNIDLDI